MENDNSNPVDAGANEPQTERIAKFLARAGLASRRQAEQMIEEGRVTVNGARLESAAFNVGAGDKIAVDGKLVRKPPLRLWLYHKPRGLVTTAHDEKDRKTIYNQLPGKMAEMRTIGRLDLNSEGLLLLTNDGDLKRALELPSTAWRRKYRVRAFGKPNEAKLEILRAGVRIEGTEYRPIDVRFDREQGDNSWYTVSLREGKNREIRRLFEHIGLQVNRLIRTSYGPFQLGAMEKGELNEMHAKALRTLLGGLLPEGAELAEAPMDLSEPVIEAPPHKGQSSREARDMAEKNAVRHERRAPKTPRTADERKPFGDRPKRDFGEKPSGERKPFGARPPRDGDAPRGERKPYGDRPKRDFGAKPNGDRKSYGNRPTRDFSDKPSGDRRPFDDRPRRDFGDRPAGGRKPYGDRPRRDFTERPIGERKPYGDRAKRDFGDRPARDDAAPRGEQKPYGERPRRDYGDRPAGDRKSYGDRPKRDFGNRPAGERKSFGDRPKRDNAETPAGVGRPNGDRPRRDSGDRQQGSRKAFGDRPNMDGRPKGERQSHSARPSNARPTGIRSNVSTPRRGANGARPSARGKK